MTQHPPTADELLRAVTDTFDLAQPPGEDDSLISWGLDSITLMKIMRRLAAAGRQDRFRRTGQ